MRNKVDACIVKTQESNIKFEENQKKIIFRNPSRLVFLKVDVDGCTITGKDISNIYILKSGKLNI